MKKKLDVQDLKVGMYVSQLDRPWLETPFKFQGFVLQTEGDVSVVQRFSMYAYIDTEKGMDIDKKLSSDRIFTLPPPPKRSRKYEIFRPLEDEITVATEIRHTTRSCIDSVFQAIEKGEGLDVEQVKEVVSNMVDSIIRNPNAQLCLAQLKSRDEYTAQHSVNVCVLTVTFGRHLGMVESTLNLLGMGALLHDIGKIKTPLEILNKPGKLTDEEFIIMKSHPEQGRKILSDTKGIPDSVIDIAFSHHERLGGHGYPSGLPSGQISSWSKIVAIVDVYDAITSDRCYHDGMSPTQALTKMYGWRHRDFDPEILEQFIQCIGIYPVGTFVELSSGEAGVVISANPEQRLKPKIILVLDENKNPYFPTRIIDLSTFDDEENCYGIRGVLEPKDWNISVKDYIGDIQKAQMTRLADKKTTGI